MPARPSRPTRGAQSVVTLSACASLTARPRSAQGARGSGEGNQRTYDTPAPNSALSERAQCVRVARLVLGSASVAHGGLGIVEMPHQVREGRSSRTGSPPHKTRRRSRSLLRLREVLVCIPYSTHAALHDGGARRAPTPSPTRGAVSRLHPPHRPPHRAGHQTNMGTNGPRGILVGVWGVCGVAASDKRGQTPRGSGERSVRSTGCPRH